MGTAPRPERWHDLSELSDAVHQQPDEFDDATKLRVLARRLAVTAGPGEGIELAPGVSAYDFLIGLAQRLDAYAVLTGEWPGWEPPLRHLRTFLDRTRRLSTNSSDPQLAAYRSGAAWAAQAAFRLLEDVTDDPGDPGRDPRPL